MRLSHATFDPPRAWPDRFGAWWQTQFPQLGLRLANLESRILRDELDAVKIDRPIFIAGLPHSGTTMMLEFLASMPSFTSHQYADFPLLWTPYWWNWLRARLPLKTAAPIERAHADRIMVTRASPEAFEEPLWNYFFPDLHQEKNSELFTETTSSPAFEKFLVDHIGKLLLARKATRYVSKGNYNLLRLPYLAKIFPDARFIIPIRHPQTHLYSLLKQDRLFANAPNSVLRQIARTGHHEFGPLKRISHWGDDTGLKRVKYEFARARDTRAWLQIWVAQYQLVLTQLQENHDLASRCLILPYEVLCLEPDATLQRLLQHVELALECRASHVEKWRTRISAPKLTHFDMTEDAQELYFQAERLYQDYGQSEHAC